MQGCSAARHLPSSPTQLKRPISGPPFAAYASIVCTGVYVILLRDPTGATAAALRAVGLPAVLPLGGDFAHSLTLLCVLTVLLQNRALTPQSAFARYCSEALARWVPGFRPVLVPTELGVPPHQLGMPHASHPPHADAFGYERLPDDDDGNGGGASARSRDLNSSPATPRQVGRP